MSSDPRDPDAMLDPELLAQIDQLERFRPGSREELMRLFHGSMQRDLSACAAALESRDGEALRAAAHSIKGSSAGLGARGLSQQAGAIERRAAQASWDSADADLAQLRSTYARVSAALATWADARAAE